MVKKNSNFIILLCLVAHLAMVTMHPIDLTSNVYRMHQMRQQTKITKEST